MSEADPQPKPKRGHTRSDAKLIGLPLERRRQIWEWTKKQSDRTEDGKTIPKTGGYAYAQAQLAADGVSVSPQLLSEFCAFMRMEEEFLTNDAETKQVEEFLRTRFPEATPEKIAAAGQLIFTLKAKNSGDTSEFIALENLRLAKDTARFKGEIEKLKLALKERAEARSTQALALEREKFEWDNSKAVLAHLKDLKIIAADRTLNDDQKIEQVRLRLWGAPPKELEDKAR